MRVRESHLDAISPAEFEELIYWLLHREGFFNISWYGFSGSDLGRDITCQRTELLGPRILTRNFVIQCKRYRRPLSRTDIHEDLLKALAQGPDYIILATSNVLSATAKDWLTSHEQFIRLPVVLWERGDIEILLERHQDLRYRFCGVPASPHYFSLQQLSRANPSLQPIAATHFDPVATEIIARAAGMALEGSSAITSAHLLLAALEIEEGIASIVFTEAGVDPHKLADFLANTLISAQPRHLAVSAGRSATVSFCFALRGAKTIADRLTLGYVPQEALVLSLLLQSDSETVRFLRRISEIDFVGLIEVAKRNCPTPNRQARQGPQTPKDLEELDLPGPEHTIDIRFDLPRPESTVIVHKDAQIPELTKVPAIPLIGSAPVTQNTRTSTQVTDSNIDSLRTILEKEDPLLSSFFDLVDRFLLDDNCLVLVCPGWEMANKAVLQVHHREALSEAVKKVFGETIDWTIAGEGSRG